MFSKISISRMFSVLIVIVLMTGSAAAHPLGAALGTGFTYQGKLTDSGAPANGVYDFEFKLYDALSGGSQVGSTVTQSDVTVTNGLFTVQLDFGNVFNGTALYLQVGVRPGASIGVYTPLTPRQTLTATPYAIYASKAPWSGLSGVPAGFADGVDNNTTYTAGDGLELVGTQFKGKGTSYQNVVIVAQSGGDFTSISAALDRIPDASDTNRYLVYVAPGVYNEQVTMKSFVDIQGSGELTTKITFTGSAVATTGTLVGASDAEVRFLTVENTGGAAYAIAIYNNKASPRLTHLTASASGGISSNYGVFNDTSSPVMTNVTASASGGTDNVGVENNSTSSPTMTNVTATASGGSNSYGVGNNSTSSPTMTNVTASASGGTGFNMGVANSSSSSPVMANVTANASGGSHSFGVYNGSASSPTMTNVTVSAWGGGFNYGVYNDASSAIINNSVISGIDYGIYNIGGSGSFTVQVNNSQITGNTNTILNDWAFITHVGASQLSGGAIIGGGTVSCIGVYDENYASPAYTTCP